MILTDTFLSFIVLESCIISIHCNTAPIFFGRLGLQLHVSVLQRTILEWNIRWRPFTMVKDCWVGELHWRCGSHTQFIRNSHLLLLFIFRRCKKPFFIMQSNTIKAARWCRQRKSRTSGGSRAWPGTQKWFSPSLSDRSICTGQPAGVSLGHCSEPVCQAKKSSTEAQMKRQRRVVREQVLLCLTHFWLLTLFCSRQLNPRIVRRLRLEPKWKY